MFLLSSFERREMKVKTFSCLILYVCVCVYIKLSCFKEKLKKIYIHTQLSESDINHNNEIPGYRRGSEVRLLGRRRKEKL